MVSMRILQINATYKIGSTGKIMSDLDDVINQNGHDGYMLCAYSLVKKNNLYVMDSLPFPFNSKSNILRMRIFGLNGYAKRRVTRKAIEWIDRIKPDIIHLHNIHGDWINLPLLFEYLNNTDTRIVWTLHDCWPFTGRCSHFELCGCNKWKDKCYKCTNKRVYPITYFFDFSRKMHNDKKSWYGDWNKMAIVTPSFWLAEYVKESFLKNNRVLTIHNGINTSLYHNVKCSSSIIKGINKRIILGVASSWSFTKGFDDFIQLDKMINHEEYIIVLVGLNEKQMKLIPDSILGIKRTNNEKELVELYSSAFVFVNMTYQDNYPTTNMEALACGTPVITYNTGGSPESIGKNGFVVEQGQIEEVWNIVKKMDKKLIIPYSETSRFDKNVGYKAYLELYSQL